MRFCLEAACGCNTGRLRKNNEDNYYFEQQILRQENNGLRIPLYKRFSRETVCFAVFDGMGGHEDGQVASYIAADIFKRDCEQIERGGMLSENFFSLAVNHMNDAVCIEAQRLKNNMGTTAVMIGFCDDLIYICNIGDSRAYRFRDNHLIQISMDHTEAIPPFMQGSRQRKPKLSQCIGISPEELLLEPYLAQGYVKKQDRFLICSDGLTDMLSDNEIEEILSSERDSGVCVQQLIDKALEHGGKDNVTAIIVRAIETAEER